MVTSIAIIADNLIKHQSFVFTQLNIKQFYFKQFYSA